MVKVGVIRKSFSKFVSFGPKFCSISSNLACLLFQCITIQIFNTEAPVLLFNLLGWGEIGRGGEVQSFSPREKF